MWINFVPRKNTLIFVLVYDRFYMLIIVLIICKASILICPRPIDNTFGDHGPHDSSIVFFGIVIVGVIGEIRRCRDIGSEAPSRSIICTNLIGMVFNMRINSLTNLLRLRRAPESSELAAAANLNVHMPT
jgi:hypothetical protein